jgi:hypothetical protein
VNHKFKEKLFRYVRVEKIVVFFTRTLRVLMMCFGLFKGSEIHEKKMFRSGCCSITGSCTGAVLLGSSALITTITSDYDRAWAAASGQGRNMRAKYNHKDFKGSLDRCPPRKKDYYDDPNTRAYAKYCDAEDEQRARAKIGASIRLKKAAEDAHARQIRLKRLSKEMALADDMDGK